MYNPESFFDIEILEEVLSSYDWPSNYTLEKVGAGNIKLRFPKCSIVFSEGFESSMNAYFLNSDTNRAKDKTSLKILDAVNVLKSSKEKEPGYKPSKDFKLFLEDEPSRQKVKDGLNNICILLQTYLLECIQGDFSWVEMYENGEH
jgi:hypothetical protein